MSSAALQREFAPVSETIAAPRPAHYRVAVVILNYRTPQLVIDCLASLASEVDPLRDVVVVVDNASGDDSVERIEAAIEQNHWTEWCQFIPSPDNNGFSAGNNLGCAAVAADYYLLTNSDTLFRPGAIEELLRGAAAHPQAAMLGPRLECLNGDPQVSCFKFHSPLSELIDAAATGPLTKLLSKFDVPRPVIDHSECYDWLGFPCVLVRSDVLRQVGPMDEGFFMYYEDVDYCRRIRRAGGEIRYWPAARVVHLGGQSSNMRELTAACKRRPKYFYAARARYYAKHFGHLGLWLANGLWMAGRVFSLAQEKFRGRPTHICDSQARDVWTNGWRPLTGPRR